MQKVFFIAVILSTWSVYLHKSNQLILAIHTYGKIGLIDWQHCCFVNIISQFFGLKNLSQMKKRTLLPTLRKLIDALLGVLLLKNASAED